MKLLGRSNGLGWMRNGSLLAAALAMACASETSEDGSQTHFSEGDDDAQPTSSPTSSGPTNPSDDDDTTDVADDDGAETTPDDAPPSDDTDTADDDTADTGDDDSVDLADDDVPDDLPADDVDDDVPPVEGSGGAPPVEPEPCVGDECNEACTGTDCADDDVEPYDPCAGKLCGEACTFCDPADPDCAEDPVDLTCSASGQCELGAAECTVRPLCAATEFESTEDGCVEESWAWDGVQCSSVTHCSCASGDCDRVYPDAAACEAAHALCLPLGCDAQDARSSGLMCGTIEGFSFDGAMCNTVFCVCSGEDCEDIEPTIEECEARFAPCMERVPQCTPSLLPTVNTDPGYTPDYPSYDFAVEGYEPLFDEESQGFVVFADWTRAAWVGWEEPAEPNFCGSVPPARFLTNCPAPRGLLLDVDGEVVRLDVTMHWDELVLETTAPAEVDVRISASPTGTWALEVKDAATELPVLMVVKSAPGATGADGGWEFAPFTFTPSEAVCATSPDSCNWTFSGRSLEVTTDEGQELLNPLVNRRMTASGAEYALFHGYIFEQSTVTDLACATAASWHQNFALVQIPPEE